MNHTCVPYAPDPTTRRAPVRAQDPAPGPHRQAGSATMEMVVSVPALGLVIALVLLGARVVTAEQVVTIAAFDAARSASITRDVASMPDRARQAAAVSIANQDLTCTSVTAAVDTSRVAITPGQPSQVTVTVRCVVPLADLALGPVTHTVQATATSPVDSWRSQ